MTALNCTPPYITDNKKIWCQERIDLSPKAKSFLADLRNNRLEKGECYQPCRFTQ